MSYGLQIFDPATGNVTLDISDATIRDIGLYSNSSITANGDITGVTIPAGAEVVVVNNTGDSDTSYATPDIYLDRPNNRIQVSGGDAGFNVGIRLVMLE